MNIDNKTIMNIDKKLQRDLIEKLGSIHKLEEIKKNYKHIKNYNEFNMIDYQYQEICNFLFLNHIHKHIIVDTNKANKYLAKAQRKMYFWYEKRLLVEKINFYSNVFFPNNFDWRK